MRAPDDILEFDPPSVFTPHIYIQEGDRMVRRIIFVFFYFLILKYFFEFTTMYFIRLLLLFPTRCCIYV